MYEPKDVESRWITYWEKHVNLRPHPESDKEFSMVLLSDYPNLTDPSASERDGPVALGSRSDRGLGRLHHSVPSNEGRECELGSWNGPRGNCDPSALR